MEAIILAGGLGKRLRPVTGDILPKVMAPVAGRPFLEHVLDHAIKQGITRVILAVGYQHDAVMTQMGASYKSIQIEYSIESEPLGTGGAIAQALRLTQSECVIVLNGDTYFSADFQTLRHKLNTAEAHIALALKPMQNFDRYGTVELRDDRITAFHEKKPCTQGLINGGVYAVRRDLYDQLALPRIHSWERDVLEKNVSTLHLIGDVQDAPFIDIGIPEDFARAQAMFSG